LLSSALLPFGPCATASRAASVGMTEVTLLIADAEFGLSQLASNLDLEDCAYQRIGHGGITSTFRLS
jgi:hypothetical protein